MSDDIMLPAVLRADMAALSERIMQELERGSTFAALWHHLAIIHQLNRAALRRVRRLLINQPPKTAKTHLVSVTFVVHLLLQDPSTKIAILAYDQALASRSIRQIRDCLQRDWCKGLAPDTRIRADKNTESHFETTAGGEVRAFSLEGGITGHGYDFIVIDDPMKAGDAHSETARRALEEKFRSEVANRWRDPTRGVLIVVMQRLHVDDFSAFFLRTYPDATHLNIPAIAPADLTFEIGNGLWHTFRAGTSIEPARMPLSYLDEIRRVQGSMNFYAQYLQDPPRSGARVLNPDWFLFFDKTRDPDYTVISIDPAFTKDKGANTAVIVGNMIGQDLEIIHAEQGQYDYPDLVRFIRKLDKRFKPDLFVIETVGAGKGLPHALEDRRITHVGCIGSQTKSKVERMEIVSPLIEQGRVSIDRHAPWREDFLRIMGDFPYGTSDDWPDALSQLLLYWDEAQRRARLYRSRRFPDDPLPDRYPIRRGGLHYRSFELTW